MPSSPARAGTTAVAGVAAAVLMLVLVTWAAAIGPEQVFNDGTFVRDSTAPIASSSATETLEPEEQEQSRDKRGGASPGWLRVLAVGVEVAFAVVALYLLVRLLLRVWDWWRGRVRSRRRRPLAEVEFEVLDPVADVVAAMEEDAEEQRELLEEGDPRNAIVACWRRFEEQAGRAGLVRRPWQTSSEFVLGVLERVGADEGAVLRLAALFREARFSDHPLTEQHRDRALEALSVIHRSLGRSRSVR